MGQVSALLVSNLHVDIQERVEAIIKEGRSNPKRGLSLSQKSSEIGTTETASRRKSPWLNSVHLCDRHEHHDLQLFVHQGQAFRHTLYKFIVWGPPAQVLAHCTGKGLRNETLHMLLVEFEL